MTTVNDQTRTRAVREWERAERNDNHARERQTMARAQRERAVAVLRAAGLSLRATADVLGVTHTTVAKYDTPDK